MSFRRMLVLLRLGLAAGAATVPGSAGAQDAVKARQDNFHVLSDRMRDIVKGLGDGLPVSAMRGWAVNARGALERVPGLFPEGSDVGKTKASPLVWSEPARFRLTYEAADERMKELVAAAQGEDRDAFGAAVGRMAAACGNCHHGFRKD